MSQDLWEDGGFVKREKLGMGSMPSCGSCGNALLPNGVHFCTGVKTPPVTRSHTLQVGDRVRYRRVDLHYEGEGEVIALNGPDHMRWRMANGKVRDSMCKVMECVALAMPQPSPSGPGSTQAELDQLGSLWASSTGLIGCKLCGEIYPPDASMHLCKALANKRRTLEEILGEIAQRRYPMTSTPEVDPNQAMIERDGSRRYVPTTQEKMDREDRQRRARNKTRYYGRWLIRAMAIDSAPWAAHYAAKPTDR